MKKYLFLILSCIVAQDAVNAMVQKPKLTIVRRPTRTAESTMPTTAPILCQAGTQQPSTETVTAVSNPSIQGPEKSHESTPSAAITQQVITELPIAAASVLPSNPSVESAHQATTEIKQQLTTEQPKDYRLYDAAKDGDIAQVRVLLAVPGIDVNLKKYNAFTPLHIAIIKGHLEVIKLLLSNGADANPQFDYEIPLHCAVNEGNKEIVQALLSAGVNVNQQDHSGETPLHRAVRRRVNKEIVQALISAGANVNQQDQSGETPLHYAARGVNKEIVQALISAGANVNQQGHSGGTPLHYAADEGNKEIIQALISAGANVNQQDHSGETPLHCVCGCYEQDEVALILILLIRAGADVNKRNKSDETPLHFAAFRGNQASVGILLSHGAYIDSRDIEGNSPLYWAIKCQNQSIVKLIKNRISHQLCEKFETLLLLSPEQFELEIKKEPSLLKERNEETKTILACAIEKQKIQHIKILLDLYQHNEEARVVALNDFKIFNTLKRTRSLKLARLILKIFPITDELPPANTSLAKKYSYRELPIGNTDRLLLSYDGDTFYDDSFAFFACHYNRCDNQLFNALLLADYQTMDVIFANDPAKLNEVIPTTHAVHCSPLAWARALKDRELIEYLVHKGAEDRPNEDQALLRAEIMGGDPFYGYLLDYGKALINNADECGMSPLHWACIYGRTEIIARLIQRGAYVDLVDRDKGRTPLRWALRMHKGSVAKGGSQMYTSELLPCFFLLMAAGAQSKIRDIHGHNVPYWIPGQGFSRDEESIIRSMLSLGTNGRRYADHIKDYADRYIREIFELQLKELKRASSQQDYAKVRAIFSALVAEKTGDHEYTIKSFYAPYLTSGKLKIELEAQ